MSVTPDMRCKVQHLQFDSIVEMLENFKRHPIPLEVGSNADVVLGNYVTAAPTVSPPPLPPPFPSASLLERKDSEKEALGWGGLFVSLPPKGRQQQQQVPQRGFREGRSQSMSASLTSNHHHHTGSRAHNNLYSVM